MIKKNYPSKWQKNINNNSKMIKTEEKKINGKGKGFQFFFGKARKTLKKN